MNAVIEAASAFPGEGGKWADMVNHASGQSVELRLTPRRRQDQEAAFNRLDAVVL